MPGLVAFANQLGDLAIGTANDVMGAGLTGRIAQPRNGAGVIALGRMDHRLANGKTTTRRIVGRSQPDRGRVVGALHAVVPATLG